MLYCALFCRLANVDFPCLTGLLHWHWGLAQSHGCPLVWVKQQWRLWLNKQDKSTQNGKVTTTKQSKTKQGVGLFLYFWSLMMMGKVIYTCVHVCICIYIYIYVYICIYICHCAICATVYPLYLECDIVFFVEFADNENIIYIHIICLFVFDMDMKNTKNIPAIYVYYCLLVCLACQAG